MLNGVMREASNGGKIQQERAIGLLRRLVQIDSVNPAFAEGRGGEAGVVAALEEALQHPRIALRRLEARPGRPTLLATLPGYEAGEKAERRLQWNGHTDTVGVAGMAEPLGARLEGGRVYGRGAYDMKGSVAGMAEALLVLAEREPLGTTIQLAAVADEEYASEGTEALLQQLQAEGQMPQAAVVTEPTEERLCLAHKGFAWFTVTASGRAAHGSRVDLGIDANLRMVQALRGLPAYAAELQAREAHGLCGAPSVHLARLEGGTDWSTYAAECTARVERRMIPGESIAAVEAELQQRVGGEGITVQRVFWRAPYEGRRDSTVARALAKVLQEGEPVGQTPWFDAALLAEAGVETVMYGPKGGGAHAAVEWVEVESYLRYIEGLVAMSEAYDGMSRRDVEL